MNSNLNNTNEHMTVNNTVQNARFAKTAFRKAFRIALIYFLFGCTWILFSDYVADVLFVNHETFIYASSVKGCVFVLFSAALVFSLILPLLKKILMAHNEILEKKVELERTLKELSQQQIVTIESERRFEEIATTYTALFEQATIGIAIGHTESNIGQNVNPAFLKITKRTIEELQNIKWEDLTHPDDLTKDFKSLLKFREGGGDIYEAEKRLIKPDGSAVWVNMTISELHILNNPNINHICIIEDISDRKELELQLLNSEHRKTLLLNNLPGMAYRCSYNQLWTMTYVSDGCLALTGFTPDDLTGTTVSYGQLITPSYRTIVWDTISQCLFERKKFSLEYEIQTESGETKWVWQQGVGVYDMCGRVKDLEGIILDITVSKKQKDELIYRDEHNTLTGLYNRHSLISQLEKDRRMPSVLSRALLIVYIKNLNTVALTHGYSTVEGLVLTIAKSLSAFCGNCSCTIYHITNERYAIYKNDYSREQLTEFCNKLIAHIDDYLNVYGINCSIGIIELHHVDADTEIDCILKFAAIAAEHATLKNEYRFCYFNDDMEAAISRYKIIQNELLQAANDDDNENLYLQFQPIINARTNEIYAFEALARMNTQNGNILPAEFIPIAEQTSLIIPLGQKIIYQAFKFLKKLENAGHDRVAITINVSVIQILRHDFMQMLSNAIEEIEVNPKKVIIEITESAFADNYQRINAVLDEMNALGISVAIDDFGTGYSSLSRERELNVDILKIDKQFMDKLDVIDEQYAITADIISMAHKLGHTVIVEGVEQEKQLHYLLKNNCDYFQGYLFSKPVSSDKAIQLFSDRDQGIVNF